MTIDQPQSARLLLIGQIWPRIPAALYIHSQSTSVTVTTHMYNQALFAIAMYSNINGRTAFNFSTTKTCYSTDNLM